MPRSLRSLLFRNNGNLDRVPSGHSALGFVGGDLVIRDSAGNDTPVGGGGTVGGQANDAFGTSTNEDGGKDLVLWNQTQNKFQRVRLSGTAGNETLIIIDTP